MKVYDFTYDKAVLIAQAVGNRPGKTYNPEYVQRGYGGKWRFWNDATGKWVRLTPGMQIVMTPDGPRLG